MEHPSKFKRMIGRNHSYKSLKRNKIWVLVSFSKTLLIDVIAHLIVININDFM